MTDHDRIKYEFSKNANGFTSGEWAILTGSTKLTTRICEMEKRGFVFERSDEEKNGKHYFRYRLVSEPAAFKQESTGQLCYV